VTSQVKGATDAAQSTAEGAAGSAQEASQSAQEGAGNATGKATEGLRAQAVGAFTNAAKDILGPPIQQLSTQAAEQAANYAKEQAPKLLKEQVLPLIMKQVGADNPADIGKKGIGLVGDQIKDAGGLTGFAGKMLSKVGGGGKGKGGGNATGYGVKRRMPIQQDMFVSVSVEDAFKGWTEYKRWTEFMHRANTVDSQIEDEEEGEARVKVTEKMWMFKRPFTAQIDSQVPNEHIRWKSTEGTKHVGVIAFHELGDRLTLISVNLDHGPSGPIEKIARGARFSKRAVRADLHRFKGWIEMKTAEDIEDIEGWLGTIENGKIVQTHEDYLQEQEEDNQDGQEQDGEGQAEAGQEDEDREGAALRGGRSDRSGQEGQEGAEEDGEDDQALEDDEDEDNELEEDEDEEEYEDEEDEEEDEEEEPEPAVAESDEAVNLDDDEPESRPRSKSAAKKPTAKKGGLKKVAAKRKRASAQR